MLGNSLHTHVQRAESVVYSTESYFSVLPWYYFFVELLVACKTLELAETNVGHGSPATDN